MQCLYVDTEADNQVVIGCGITENVDEFAADRFVINLLLETMLHGV